MTKLKSKTSNTTKILKHTSTLAPVGISFKLRRYVSITEFSIESIVQQHVMVSLCFLLFESYD